MTGSMFVPGIPPPVTRRQYGTTFVAVDIPAIGANAEWVSETFSFPENTDQINFAVPSLGTTNARIVVEQEILPNVWQAIIAASSIGNSVSGASSYSGRLIGKGPCRFRILTDATGAFAGGRIVGRGSRAPVDLAYIHDVVCVIPPLAANAVWNGNPIDVREAEAFRAVIPTLAAGVAQILNTFFRLEGSESIDGPWSLQKGTNVNGNLGVVMSQSTRLSSLLAYTPAAPFLRPLVNIGATAHPGAVVPIRIL